MDNNARESEEAYYAQFGMFRPRALTESRAIIEPVRKLIQARRRRSQYLSSELFGEPAWDILLELLYAELMQVRITMTRLCRRTGIPQGTAVRWLRSMTDRGLVLRHGDPFDSRRVFLELAPSASEALHQFFADEWADDNLERR